MRLFLPVARRLDDSVGALDLGERHVAPAEAVAGGLHAEARAGAAPHRVDPREVPVDEVVVGEGGVVGDVLQVVEDRSRGAETTIDTVTGSTAGRSLLTARSAARGRAGAAGACAPPRAQAARAVQANGLAVLAVADQLTGQRRIVAQLAAKLADDSGSAGGPRTGGRARRSGACARSPSRRCGRRSALSRPRMNRPRSSASMSRWISAMSMLISPPRAAAPAPRSPSGGCVSPGAADGYRPRQQGGRRRPRRRASPASAARDLDSNIRDPHAVDRLL